MNGDCRLIIGRSGKNLALLSRNRGVFINQLSGHSAKGFDTERQRSDIQQQNIFHIALKNTTLNGGTNSHNLIRVHTFMGLLAKDLFYFFLYLRHSAHSTNEDNLINVRGGKSGILERGLTRSYGTIHKVIYQALIFCTAQLYIQMFGTGCIRCNKWQIDLSLCGGGKFHLGLFTFFFQTLKGHFITTKIYSLLSLELIGKPVHDTHIKIFTTKERVAVG